MVLTNCPLFTVQHAARVSQSTRGLFAQGFFHDHVVGVTQVSSYN